MNNIWNLTDREYEILKFITQGLSNPEIAKKLYITTHTVKAHILAIYQKTGIHSRVVLAVRAIKLRIINTEHFSE